MFYRISQNANKLGTQEKVPEKTKSTEQQIQTEEKDILEPTKTIKKRKQIDLSQQIDVNPPKESPSKKLNSINEREPSPLEKEYKSATLIQSKIRGFLTRSAVVLPREIQKYLQENLEGLKTSKGETINLDDLSKALAREILDFANDKNAFNGHGKRLLEDKQLYTFPKFEGTKHVGKETVPLPVGVWAKRSQDGKSIELELIGQSIGSGTYKEVFKSKPLLINLATPEHKKEISDRVVVHAKGIQHQGVVLKGQKVVSDNFNENELNDPELRLAGVLTHTDRVNQGLLEATDEIYSGSLEDQKLNIYQKVQVLADVGQSLTKFHEKGLVHRDVKPGNIFIGKGDHGFLGDFDLTQKQGMGFKSEYPYWDPLSEQGLVTSFSDIHGLAVTAAVTLFNAGDLTTLQDRSGTVISDLLQNELKSLNIKYTGPQKTTGEVIRGLESQDFLSKVPTEKLP